MQHDSLNAAGCLRIFSDTASGALDERPELARLLDQLRDGDTLVVWRLDRLGRSLRHLIETVTALADRGVGFRSLQESIDTTTPGGRLIFHGFGALSEFERELIRERTHAGLAAARARGRKGGRPSVMTPAKLAVARDMYASREHTIAAIAAIVGVSRATLYRALGAPAPPMSETPARRDPKSTAVAERRDPKPMTSPPDLTPAADVPGDPPLTSELLTPSAKTTRRRRAARLIELPSAADALRRECPNCGAHPGVMCRDLTSRAKRQPANECIHSARLWLDRRCPACRAPRGEPCRTPGGRQAADIHTARLRPTQAETDARAEFKTTTENH